MKQLKIANLAEFKNWILKDHNWFQIFERNDGLDIQCPYDAPVSIIFENENNIEEVILNAIEIFEDFNADEKFNEYWSFDFQKREWFTASEFLRMLINDEGELHEMAKELREVI